MQDIWVFLCSEWLLVLGIVVVLLLILTVELVRRQRQPDSFTVAETVHAMNHDNATVIDLRDSDDYRRGHIINARSMPLGTDYAHSISGNMKKLKSLKDSVIVLICPTGLLAPKVATLLKQQGFTKVQVLSGGMQAWLDAEMPIVKKEK